MEYVKYSSYYQTERKKGVLGLYSSWTIPTVDIVNIPYEGNSIHKSFFVENRYANFHNISTSADGINLYDGKIRGDYMALQGGLHLDEQFKDTIPLAKYYGFLNFMPIWI